MHQVALPNFGVRELALTDRWGLDDEGNNDSYGGTVELLDEAYGGSVRLPASTVPINNPRPSPTPEQIADDLSLFGDYANYVAAFGIAGANPEVAGIGHFVGSMCRITAEMIQQNPQASAFDLMQDALYNMTGLDQIQDFVTFPVNVYYQTHTHP